MNRHILVNQMIGKRESLSGKGNQVRFNLLLIEDGEYYLEDYSVFRYPCPEISNLSFSQCLERKIQGRLKVCTRSLIFEPHDTVLPLCKFLFRKMKRSPVAQLFSAKEDGNEFLTFRITEIIEMKSNGMDSPYQNKPNLISRLEVFSLTHSKLRDFVHLVQPLWELAQDSRVLNKIDEESRLSSILSKRITDQFDTSLLVDFRERPLLPRGAIVTRISPLLKHPGCLMLTNSRLYFQPAQVNNVGDPVVNYPFSKIKHIYKRRHMLRQCGLEIYLNEGQSVFFSFPTREGRDQLYDRIIAQPGLDRLYHTDHLAVLLKWQSKEISNFDYLVYLNDESDRTMNDLTQYPVFPWIISDYENPILDLKNRKSFRDLSKPIGALNPERLEYFRKRYEAMPKDMEAEGIPPPFLYGTHYSTPGYVLYFLVRQSPEYMLCLQNGKFDSPDRLFKSISETWNSCLNNPTDLKELIPAFYCTELPAQDWLQKSSTLELGTTQKGHRVGDVILPPWAKDAKDFIQKNREALESDYVSENLHHWIDLIFGYKQTGDEAIKADNLFYYLSYEGSVDLEKVTDFVERCSLEAQIQEFGQTPKKLFQSPHPSRYEMGKTVELAVVRPVKEIRQKTNKENEKEIVVEEEEVLNQKRRPSSGSIFSLAAPFKSKLVDRFDKVLNFSMKKSQNHTQSPNHNCNNVFTKWNWQFNQSNSSMTLEGSSPLGIHRDSVTSVQFSLDNQLILSSSRDTFVKMIEVKDARQKRSFHCDLSISSCALSSDNKFIFAGSWDNYIYMYSIEFGRIVDKFLAHNDGISCLLVVADQILTGSWDCFLKLWKYSSQGIQPNPLFSSETSSSIICCSSTNNGQLVAIGCENGTISLYNLQEQELLITTNANSTSGKITCISFSSNGCSFISSSSDNFLCVYTITGIRLFAFKVNIEGELNCIATDGEYAIGGGSDGNLRIWNILNKEDIEDITVYTVENAHKKGITCIHVSKDGKLILTGSDDKTIRIWTLIQKKSRIIHL